VRGRASPRCRGRRRVHGGDKLPKVDATNPSWDRCYDFKIIFANFFGEKIGAFDTNLTNSEHNIVF
jgi:hypothetical protein